MQNEIETLKLRVAALEARLSNLEGCAPKSAPVTLVVQQREIADPLMDAIKANLDKMHGRLTTKEIATIAGIDSNNHANLVKMGIVLAGMGIKKVRTASGNVFVFAENASEQANYPINLMKPVPWLRGSIEASNAALVGVMTVSEIMREIDMERAPHHRATLLDALKTCSVPEAYGRGEQAFDFGTGREF